MQDESQRSTTGGTSGRSSIERLPPALRDAVDAAVADGTTVDEIVALICAHGGTCSRSAVGRYAKRARGLIRQQYEADRIAGMWARALGERAEGRTGLLVIETLRTLALFSVADLGERKKSVTTKEIARLALAARRLEGADKLRIERERAVAEAAARGGRAARSAGLSAETVAAINTAILGRPLP